jgi:hypothetical protein
MKKPWRIVKGEEGPMAELRTPCGKHVVYCPAALATAAISPARRCVVFLTSCECPTDWLVGLTPAGPRFWRSVERYEKLPWPDSEEVGGEQFFFKTAPSEAELEQLDG